ncbi:MAG: TerB family tellurite resistance protein [Rhodospirillales bacterium]|nr:TerB family tellurite resistance protein [Rhodospirillales bacterium]
MTPLQILATSLAYAIMADDDAATEEKAKMVGLLGKHLADGEISGRGLKDLSATAFSHARRENMAIFLETHSPSLSRGQKLCILINLFDMIMADGHLKLGEAEVLASFRTAFGFSKSEMRPIQKVLQMKNDTAMFFEPNHPANSPQFKLDLSPE